MTTENPLDPVVQLARAEALDNLYFMDGATDIDVGYTLKADTIEEYEW